MPNNGRFRLRLLLLSLLGINQLLYAAHYPNPLIEQNLEQKQKALLQQAQQQRQALQQQTPLLNHTRPAERQAAAQCHWVKQINLIGDSHLAHQAKRQILARWQQRCLTLSNIQQLLHQVTNWYLQQGYITSSAWLPEQDISQGQLLIHVTEGKISQIRYSQPTDLPMSNLFPHLTGHILNLRQIEQGLEQVNRLATRSITIDIQPAAQAGQSLLLLKPNQAGLPLQLNLSMDNNGNNSTGKTQANITAIWDNPLQLADQWLLSYQHNLPLHHAYWNQNLQGSVSIPYGGWLFSYQYGWGDFGQAIALTHQRTRYQGNSQSHLLAVDKTLYRDGQQKLSLATQWHYQDISNRLAQQKLTVSSPKLTTLTLGANYARSLAKGYLTFNPAISRGLPIMGAAHNLSAGPLAPRSQFTKLTLSSSYFYPFTPSIYYFTSAYGQYSAQNLYSSEGLTVGGHYSVRGFKEHYLFGNQGGYWRNELHWLPSVKLPLLGSLDLVAALDTGWIKKQAQRTDGGNLTGSYLGVTFTQPHVSQTLAIAYPLAYPSQLAADHWVSYWQIALSW